MRCSKCGTNNPSTNNFCAKCGNALAKHCAKCRAENPPTSEFCGQCGTSLTRSADASAAPSSPTGLAGGVLVTPESASAEALEGERKMVTALFADIKGSTEMMEDLDPEHARNIIDPALKLMIDSAHRYDGYVVQSTGDGIFALFGAPVAHEDHPQRALYAALRIQEELRRYSARVVADGGTPIQCRIGINTGEVVIRSIQTGAGHVEYTPIGHTTNLASRMQTAAPVGSIAVTEATRKLCEGFFILKPLGATKVKGVSEPVSVFEVTGLGPLRTRLQRSQGRGYTRFVGRTREIDAMKAAADRAIAGHGQIVAAMAEPGVGKSRLVFEFKATSQSGWMVLETFSVSYGKASAYLPVVSLLHSYFEISPDDDARKRREKVAGRLAILDPSLEDTRPYLFSLLGIAEGDDRNRQHWEQTFDRLDEYLRELQKKDPLAQMDPQIKKRRTLDAIKHILLRESLNQPLMVIFEDLHWIDDETQALLNLIADSIGTARILLLVNYRPEYRHEWGSKTYYTQLRLDPLAQENAAEMLQSLIGDSAKLDELKRLIIDKTEGNPFFIEEMVQTLFEDGALTRNGTVTLASPLSELKIPTTVQGILAARIDRLPPAEKDLLQTLSVIGKEFHLNLVRAVTGTAHDRLMPMVDDLQASEFIYEQASATDLEYTFKHALTQQVAYQSVLMERRKVLHERTAAAIETIHAAQLDDYLVELAHHYSRSANITKAVDFLWRAAGQASMRSLYSEAIGYVNRALELLAATPDSEARRSDELRLQVMLGVALMAAKGFSSDEVERAFSRACELARNSDDPFQQEQRFGALQGLWGYHYTRGDAVSALKFAHESMAQARKLNGAGQLKVAHYAMGTALMQAGDLSAARDHLETSLAFAKTPAYVGGTGWFGPDPDVLCLTSLSELLFHLGYLDQSLQRSYEAVKAVTRESDPFSYAMARATVVQAHCARRDGAKSAELCRELIALCTEHGFPFWLAVANRCLAWALSLQGRMQEAVAMMQEHLEHTAGNDAEISQFNLLPILAETYGNLGEFDRGLAALEQWLEVRSKSSDTAIDKIYCRVRGVLLMKAGSTEEAEQSLRKSIQLSVGQSARMDQLWATMALARLLAGQGRRDEARAMLADIYNWFTEGLDTRDLKDAKTLLDQLSE
jgi:class 3 adenylate cyclase/tetratricopeptide (TPR) repeat protein/ribosomal protein L40E